MLKNSSSLPGKDYSPQRNLWHLSLCLKNTWKLTYNCLFGFTSVLCDFQYGQFRHNQELSQPWGVTTQLHHTPHSSIISQEVVTCNVRKLDCVICTLLYNMITNISQLQYRTWQFRHAHHSSNTHQELSVAVFNTTILSCTALLYKATGNEASCSECQHNFAKNLTSARLIIN